MPTPTNVDGFDGTGSDLGVGWSLFSGAAARVDGMATSATAFAVMAARKNVSVGSANMLVELDWVVGDSAQDRSVGVFARMSSTAQTGYLFEVNDQYDRFTVHRVVDGTATNISNGFQPIPGGLATPGRMGLRVVDDAAGSPVLTCTWRGTVVGTFTDTAAAALKSGQMGGVRIYNGGNVVRIDNYAATLASSSGSSTPPAATVFGDSFDGTGEGVAATWRTLIGSAFRDNGALSSAVSGFTVSSGWAGMNDFTAPTPAMFTELTVLALSTTADRSAGVMVRGKAGQNRGYLLELNQLNSRVTVTRLNDDGTRTPLTGFVSLPQAVELPGKLRLEAADDGNNGVRLRYFWAGVQVGVFTDTGDKAIRDGACGGVYLYNPASLTKVDEFRTGGL